MELSRYLQVLRKGWLPILLASVLGMGCAALYSVTATPKYRATTSVFFSVVGGDSVSQLLQGSTFSQNQVRTYALLAQMPAVLDPVIDELKLDISAKSLARTVNTDAPADTVLLNISATSESPETAAAVANAVGTRLGDLVSTLSSDKAGGSSGLEVQATTVAKATPPSYPVTPNTRKNMVLGLLLGLLGGVAFVVLREVLNVKVRSEEDVHAITDTPVLGLIGNDSTVSRSPMLEVHDRSQRAEAMRRLRTNLEFLNYEGQVRSFVVTSSLPGEGKTTTAANLALTISESQRVLLIDADLRNPRVADLLGVDGSVGLSTVLSGRVPVAEAIQPWKRGRFDLLASGSVPPNPAELLGSSAMADLIRAMTERYDLVIIDSAPVLPVSDSAVLSRMAGGAIIVVNARKTTRSQLSDCLRTFARSGAHIHGVVLNQATVTGATYYGTYGADRAPQSPAQSPGNPGAPGSTASGPQRGQFEMGSSTP